MSVEAVVLILKVRLPLDGIKPQLCEQRSTRPDTASVPTISDLSFTYGQVHLYGDDNDLLGPSHDKLTTKTMSRMVLPRDHVK